jgi:hypothetical protein
LRKSASSYLFPLHFKSFSLAEIAISRGFSKSKVRLSALFSPHSAFPSEGAMRKSIFSIFTIPKLKTSLQKKEKSDPFSQFSLKNQE